MRNELKHSNCVIGMFNFASLMRPILGGELPGIERGIECTRARRALDVKRARWFLIAPVAAIWLVGAMMPRTAFAITAELADKCELLANKTYPLREPGNPAAGRIGGTGRQFLDYFNECVKNGGNVGANDNQKTPNGAQQVPHGTQPVPNGIQQAPTTK